MKSRKMDRRLRGRGVFAALALVLVAGVGLVGCATLGRAVWREPVVNFQEVRLNSLGLSGGSLDVILSIHNPNNFQLRATQLRYNLLMDSVHVADGTLDSDFVVARHDSTVVPIPINFTYAGLGRAGSELIRSGQVNYRVLGDVTVSTPLGNFTLPYDQRGRFSPMTGASRF